VWAHFGTAVAPFSFTDSLTCMYVALYLFNMKLVGRSAPAVAIYGNSVALEIYILQMPYLLFTPYHIM